MDPTENKPDSITLTAEAVDHIQSVIDESESNEEMVHEIETSEINVAKKNVLSSEEKLEKLQNKLPFDLNMIAVDVDNIAIQAAAFASVYQQTDTPQSITNTNLMKKSLTQLKSPDKIPTPKNQRIVTSEIPELNHEPLTPTITDIPCSSLPNEPPFASVINAICDHEMEFYAHGHVGFSIIIFGTLYFVLGKIFNCFESDSGLILNWAFLFSGIILTITELSMMIYLLSVGFLAFFLCTRYKAQIQQAVYVAFMEINMETHGQILLGFIIVIFCLPPWLYLRDYSVRCLIDRNCIFFLSIYQALSDCICGAYHSCGPLTLCQAIVLCLPVTVLTLIPASTALYVYIKYFKHRHCISMPITPPPASAPAPEQIYTFNLTR